MTTKHVRLMLPGPVDAEDDVLAAMGEPIRPNWGSEWLAHYYETIERLQQVFGTQNDIVMMVGPGTAGLDAALGSLTRTGDKVLIAQNGFFGARLATVARNYGLDVQTVEAPLTQPLDPEAIRKRLSAEPDIQAVGVVHLETTTAVLNPLQEIALVAREFEVPIIADSISSLGGMPLPVDEWGIDICVTVTNKALGCPAGLAPLSVSQRAWEQIERKGDRAHGWWLNLEVWRDHALRQAEWHPYPTTMPTSLIYALLTSLRRIQAVGLEAHYERHAQAAQMVRGGLRRMGFEMFTREAYTAPLISAVRALPGMDIADFRNYLVDEWQIMVAGGFGELHGKIFRVGHIGKAASAEYCQRFLEGTRAYLQL